MGRPPDPTRREEVLSRAVSYLAEHGLSNLSLRKLAAAMGTSTNTISYQFGSKEELVEAALGRARATTLEVLQRIRSQEPRPSVADSVRLLWEWWMEDRRNLVSTRLSIEAMMVADKEYPKARRPELLTFWIEYFAAWVQTEANCSRREAVIQATLLMAVLSGLVVDLQSTGQTDRVRSSLDAYLSAWDGTTVGPSQ